MIEFSVCEFIIDFSEKVSFKFRWKFKQIANYINLLIVYSDLFVILMSFPFDFRCWKERFKDFISLNYTIFDYYNHDYWKRVIFIINIEFTFYHTAKTVIMTFY